MLKIFEIPALIERRDKLREVFERNQSDAVFLGNVTELFNEIDDWKYSTGAIFDQPPYSHEMAGFDGGRLLKKKYSSPYEARLKGAYSSGFITGQHRLTVHPSKPINIPLGVSRFKSEMDVLYTEHIKYYDHADFKSSKAPKLIAMNEFYEFDKNIRANVGVGDAGAFAITLYYFNEKNLIIAASTITAPFDFQSEYQMHHDENDSLTLITSGNGIVWQRKSV